MQDAGTCNTGLRWHFHVAASAANLQQNFFSRLNNHCGPPAARQTRARPLARRRAFDAQAATSEWQFCGFQNELARRRSNLPNFKIVARGITMN
jgi:hypothetical protein